MNSEQNLSSGEKEKMSTLSSTRKPDIQHLTKFDKSKSKPLQDIKAIQQEKLEELPDLKIVKAKTTLEESEIAMQEVNNKDSGGSYSSVVLKERSDFVIELYLMGYTTRDIFKNYEVIAPTKGWKPINNERTVQRIIQKYYKERGSMDTIQKKEADIWMREASLARQERIIQKAHRCINDGKNWKPFEYINALKEVFRMQQKMIENMNWNDSKKNNSITLMETNRDRIEEDRRANLKRAQHPLIIKMREQFERPEKERESYEDV